MAIGFVRVQAHVCFGCGCLTPEHLFPSRIDPSMQRWALDREAKNIAKQFMSSIALPMSTGPSPWRWQLCQLDLLLQYFVRESDFFKAIMQRAIDRHGPDLTLITYVRFCPMEG